ncbi:hypothetical protein ACFPN1_04630 [Lysobacter yangpyeongensis]|uniref:Sel1 repeat family protein n=1 Tax=Lysobacter yangpyeongensis TaxID=346182 RepID=A0ABW0SK76_9GAMM
MNKKVLFSIILSLASVGCSAGSPKDRGADAANSGRYAEAYKLWLPLAENGDSEVQESVALLLISDEDLGVALPKDQRERLALKWVVRSARNGNKSAMTWLGQAMQNGWHGLPANPVQAACWLAAGESKRAASSCVAPD